MIFCANPKQQYLSYKKEINKAVQTVMDSGHYVLGQEVKKFEQDFSAYIGIPNGIGVANGTDALEIAIRSLGISPGDEIITVSHSAVATVSAIVAAGAKPVMVDIEEDYYTIDPERIREAITEKTRALLPVHIYGQTADMTAIQAIAKEHDLLIIEDCAQAHGARYNEKCVGSFGDASAFSFYPTKNLGAIGDGGMTLVRDNAVAEKARYCREYGWEQRYISFFHGTNTRLDELQAAILNVKLKYIEQDKKKRAKIGMRYSDALKDLPMIVPKIREGSEHAFHLYVIQTDKRDDLLSDLKKADIMCAIHYPKAIHQQPAYASNADLPVTNNMYQRILSLPMYPELSEFEQNQVISQIRQYFRQ